jgi:hypothetical protein
MNFPDPAGLSDHKLDALINFTKFSKSMAAFHKALLDEQDNRAYANSRNEYDAAAQSADDECTEGESYAE